MTLVSKLGASAFLLMSMFVGVSFPTATRADIIMDWNLKADEIAAQKQVLPFNHARAVAMLQVAMFEAVNSIERRYAPYKLNLLADRNLSKEAAAASAGYDVLLALYIRTERPSLVQCSKQCSQTSATNQSRRASVWAKKPQQELSRYVRTMG